MERKSQIIMNLLVKNFFILLFVIFLFVALGQWNHSRFQQKAYDQGKELILLDLTVKGEKTGEFLEPPDLSIDPINFVILTEGGTEYRYEVSLLNPLLVQLSALNLIISPKVQIVEVDKSQP
ncbi:MAG: hypothetical protein P1S59_00815 [bacterium]|nr:hypothetical protein [bacterium]